MKFLCGLTPLEGKYYFITKVIFRLSFYLNKSFDNHFASSVVHYATVGENES